MIVAFKPLPQSRPHHAIQGKVEKLGQWMRQNDRTDPELAYWIEKYLLFWGTRSFVALVAGDGYASIDIRVAAVGQDLIGWTEFLHGKVSVEIAAIQNCTACLPHPAGLPALIG